MTPSLCCPRNGLGRRRRCNRHRMDNQTARAAARVAPFRRYRKNERCMPAHSPLLPKLMPCQPNVEPFHSPSSSSSKTACFTIAPHSLARSKPPPTKPAQIDSLSSYVRSMLPTVSRQEVARMHRGCTEITSRTPSKSLCTIGLPGSV